MFFLTLTTFNVLIICAHSEHLPNKPSTCTSAHEGASTSSIGRSALQVDYVRYGLGDTTSAAAEHPPAHASAPSSTSSALPKNLSLLESPSTAAVKTAPSLLQPSATSNTSTHAANTRSLESDIQALEAEVKYRKEEAEVKMLEYERAEEEWNTVESQIRRATAEDNLGWQEKDAVDAFASLGYGQPGKVSMLELRDELQDEELKEIDSLEAAAREARDTKDFIRDEERTITEQLTKAQAQRTHLRPW
mmetsp:Transcript_157726/g.278438  ORF Transcript_157726/g.278438 Transcript_157726/m.278438 type:complete len:248 (-) Transcript_157726:101-844(-)